MSYSSIIKKTCKCGCSKWPTTGYAGYNMDCRPDLKEKKIKEQQDRQKKVTAVRNAGNKLRSIDANSHSNLIAERNYNVLDSWFREVRKSMTGVCQNCGGKSCKDNDREYKRSIAHILPKAYFPSIATHPENFLELCFYGNSCHTNFDNKMIDLIDLNCFDTVIQKFVKIYPHIAQEERRRIPAILLEYLKVET